MPPRRDDDLEAQRAPDAFSYAPRGVWRRLLVSVRIKNKLDSSHIVRLPYNPACRFSLILLLLLVAAFLTPHLLPRWLGFEWASPRDLCRAPRRKLSAIQHRLRNLTRLPDAHRFLAVQNHTLRCMNASADRFYHGPDKAPPRFRWPRECDSAKAKTSLSETTCVAAKADVCTAVGGLAGFFMRLGANCVRKVGPDLCTETNDVNRSQALLDLERERLSPRNQNLTVEQSQPIVATANARVQDIIARLITQVDIAADAFILYSLISIAVGVPLIIYKREKGSRIVGATFGLTKITFIIVFIVIISLYDSIAVIFRETDFPRLFQNFLNDPCYVDPTFSADRAALIVDVCNNVSYIDQQSDYVLQDMDAVFYDTRLFGFCKDHNRNLSVHPHLNDMDNIRRAYRTGNISNPAVCNATQLDELTSVAPSSDRLSKWKALLGSGVVAQLALKFIVTSWILHVFAYVEPMVLHNGKVEIWGSPAKTNLTENEQDAVRRFARDKHLLALLIFSALLILEIALIIYSIATTISGGNELVPEEPLPPIPIPQNLTCPTSLTL